MNSWGRLAVFDLETTGVDVDTARIVSACVAVLADDGAVVARWDWLADPGVEIPDGAAAVHGITTERARTLGRPAGQVVAEIAQALRMLFDLGMPVVVYNAPYDLSLLDRECRRYGLPILEAPAPVIDPLVLDKAVDRYRKGKRTLEVTAELYGVELDDAHDAGADAIAAGRVALALASRYPEELDLPLAELHEKQVSWYAEQAASFADYIRRVKGDADYVADTEWPVRAPESAAAVIDTQPIPAPEPRPSRTVPHLDFDTGVLELDGVPFSLDLAVPLIEIEAVSTDHQPEPARHPEPAQHGGQAEPTPPAGVSPAYASAPPPQLPGMMTSRPTPSRPTVLRVAACIITDAAGRTLLVRKHGTSAFMQAGGKIEEGESALQALSRELREELDLELDIDVTEYLGSFRAVAGNETNTVIRAEVFALTTQRDLLPSGEIEELAWIDSDDPQGIDLAPLTRDTILPLWTSRRSALF